MVDLEWTLGAGSLGAIGSAARSAPAQSDVLLFSTPDGGEIECLNGVITMSDGLTTAVHVSLFGGNQDDSGSDADRPQEWWGNKLETDDTKKIRSETQHLMQSLPLTSGNLRLVEDAAAHDLAWMTDTELASAVVPRASIPALNTLHLEVTIEIQQREFVIELTKQWGGS